MKFNSTQKGYSLVEVLVSISVLLIATVGPMAIATQGLKSSQFALEQNTAYFLAQEGIEAVFAIRNNYALADIDNGLGTSDDISWDWVIENGELLNKNDDPCHPGFRLNNNGASCDLGVQVNGGAYNQVDLINCNGSRAENCNLKLNQSADRAMYNHDDGEDTKFSRVVTITRETDYSIKVESKVTWLSNVFKSEQSVVETTYLYDSNFES